MKHSIESQKASHRHPNGAFRKWKALGLIGLAVIFSAVALKVILTGKVEVGSKIILNPTNFARPEEIGAVVFRRFWVDLQKARFIVLAKSDEVTASDQIWRGFLAVAKQQGFIFNKMFVAEARKEFIKDIPSHPIDFVEIRRSVDAGERVLVYTNATDEEWKSFHESFKDGIYFFEGKMPTIEMATEFKEKCISLKEDKTLKCISVNSAFQGKKRKFEWNTLGARIVEFNLNAFLVLLNEPVGL